LTSSQPTERRQRLPKWGEEEKMSTILITGIILKINSKYNCKQ